MNGPRLNRRLLGFATFVAMVAACDRPVTEPDRQAPLKNAPPGGTVALVAGFQEQRFVTLGFDPTAMEFSPDGRLFVADQAGKLRVVKDGNLLPTPFLTLSVDATGERGLLGVAFDPAFGTNRHVYLYYTSSATHKNRVSRFTAEAGSADVAAPTSEVVLLDGLAGADGWHNGGAVHFGSDGKLYVAVGDNHTTANAQDLRVPEGKLLRISPDGSIPLDNPFVGHPSARGEIWALGLRNPFTFAVQPGTGRIHINDVGHHRWEEINLGRAGANYGWPTCEGVCTNPAFDNPIYTYSHDGGRCAITGGTFYQGTQFPSEYVGSYFFADYCGDWIRRRRPDGSVADFATLAGGFVVDLKVGPDGSLYYLSRAARAVYRFTSEQTNRAPVANVTASPASGLPPLEVSFDASQSSDPDGDGLVFSWDFGDGSTATGVTARHTYAADGPYVVTLTADDQKGGLGTATSTINVGNPPDAVITLPSEGATYVAGDVISFAGEGSDAEDGTLGESAFSWTILFHHENHTHPHIGPVGNVRSGTFTIPTTGETSPHVWYRIYLTVTDASGLRTTVTRDLLPVKSTLTLDADPTGLTLMLDGQPVATPHTVTGVVGIQRTLGAPLHQSLGTGSYDFVSWSDGGAGTHVISTPVAPTTYLATYAASTVAPPATVTHTLLTAGNNTVNQKVYTTAVIAPAPNTLVTVAVLGHRSISPPPSATLSGGGMTAWTEVATTAFDGAATPLKRLTIFRAMSNAPGSGPITITFSNNVSNSQWIVSQWTGVETSGANGAGAIGQTGSSRGDAVSGLAVPLTAFGNPNNVAYGVFGVRSQVAAVTPGASFTELSEQPSAESPPSDLAAEWAANVNTVAATWTNLNGGALGVEIKGAAPGLPSGVGAAQSTVSAAPTSIEAGGASSTITVTVKDASGNPISGATVMLSATGTGNTLTQPAGPTDASGVATGTLSSTVAGPKTVSARADLTPITQTAQVTVTPGPLSAEQSTVTASPSTIAAGTGVTAITVTATDANRNRISGATVVVAATGSGNTLTQSAGPTDAGGVATALFSSTVAEPKTVSATVNGTALAQTATVTVTTPAPAPAPATITQTLLAAGNNTANQKVYTTAAIAPAPNALITVAVLGHRAAVGVDPPLGAPPSPTVSGGGMTAWTEVATTTFDGVATPLKRLTIYRAMSTAPGSGPITITFSNNVSNCQWIVSQWTGVETSGVNGAGAIGQTGSTRGEAVSGLTVPLTAFGNSSDVAYGVFGVTSSVLAVTPGAGFTELSEQPSAEAPPADLMAEWATNDNTIDATWTSRNGGALGVEIRARTTGP